MRKFYTLLKREVRSYFYSPIAYIVLVFFLLLSGVDFYFQLSFMNGKPVPYTVQESFFNSVFFWFAFVLIFPLITMRLFSEEFKLGTIEPLMTAPVRDWQVVLAKFFGALVFYIVLWVPTLLYFAIFQYVTKTTASAAMGAYLGSYLMLLLLGMFYTSIGCLASVLTKNQIIAAIVSFCIITLHFFSGLLSFIMQEISSSTRQLLGYFSAIEQMGTLSRGEIDTRPIVLYVSMTIVMLALTHQAFQSRKWRLYRSTAAEEVADKNPSRPHWRERAGAGRAHPLPRCDGELPRLRALQALGSLARQEVCALG
jgi:ABC-2 type transport system permease protein